MARIEGLSNHDAGPLTRFVFRRAARRAGAVPEPLRIMARSLGVLRAVVGFQVGFDRARSLDPRLKDLACLKAASMIGCVF